MKARLAWLCCLGLAACAPQEDRKASMTEAGDAEMNAAIHKAQVSLDEFEQRLNHPPATQSYISLQGRFERQGVVEHIWLRDVAVVPGGYRGKIGNEPVEIHGLKVGQEVVLPRADVSDWMAIDSNYLIAGYSVRLLRSRMSPAERGQFDARSGFIIEE